MGGSLGTPIDDAAQDKINQTIQDVIKIFSVEFSKSYTQVVIQEAKQAGSNMSANPMNAMKLMEAPTPSYPLKTGMLIKRGEEVKNWKNRLFIVHNQADNYRIDYMDGTTKETAKLKGAIYPAGYRVYEFNSDEEAEFGEAGIKFVPRSVRHRTWWIKCGEDMARKEWMDVFEAACFSATTTQDSDPAVARTFDRTLTKLRWHYWFFATSQQGDSGTEEERLVEFILELLDRDILDAIIRNLPENNSKAQTVQLIRKSIGATVKGACASAWISSKTTVRSLSQSIRGSVNDLLSAVLQEEKKFESKILGLVGRSLIDPFIADKTVNVMQPILRVLVRPLTDVFIQLSVGFHTFVAAKLSAHALFTSAGMASRELEQVDFQMDWSTGPLHKAYQLIERIYTRDLSSVATLFSGGFTLFTVQCMLKQRVRLLAHRAVYTLGALVEQAGGVGSTGLNLTSVLNKVTHRLFHDAQLTVKQLLVELLGLVLGAAQSETVVSPAWEVIAPLQELVDGLPLAGLSMLIDLNTLLQSAVSTAQTRAVVAAVDAATTDIPQAFDMSAAELGVAKLTITK